MVWIYLAASEESASPSKTGLDPSPTAKSTPIVKKSYCPGLPMTRYMMLLYGMTSEHSKEDCFPKQSTLSLADFRAKILALQAMERAWTESEADYFSRSLDCVAKLSLDLSSWRMFRPLLQEEAPEWSEKLPRWGMIVAGVLYPLRPLEHCIDAKGGSYWLTPSTMEHLPVRTGEALENALYRGDKEKKSKRKVSGRLNEQVAYSEMWPTPDANARGARINQNGHHYTLQDAVGSGKLNPQWVAWLMGYQTEWLDCEHLEMP